MTGAETPKARRQRERRESFLEEFEPYVRRRLLPGMGLSPDGFTLAVPGHGERSMIFFLTAGDAQYVVRCYPRRSARVRTDRAVRFALRNGVHVPRILFTDRSLATRRELGHSVAVEERVQGCHTTEYPDRDRMLEIVARGFSRIQNVRRSRWGNLTVGRRRGYFERLIHGLRKHLERARRFGSAIGPEKDERIVGWASRFGPEIRRVREYSFSHRSFSAVNVVISTDDELYLIDVERLYFGHYAAGLVRILPEFDLEGESEDRFLGMYFEEAKGRTREDFEKWRAFYRLLHAVRQLNYALENGTLRPDGSPVADTLTEEIFEIAGAGSPAEP